MRRRAIHVFFLLWLGWYVSGPLFETIDCWDSPREEISDVARSAGGAGTLIAVLVSFGIALFRRLRERGSCLAVRRGEAPLSVIFAAPEPATAGASALAHSPPGCLRL